MAARIPIYLAAGCLALAGVVFWELQPSRTVGLSATPRVTHFRPASDAGVRQASAKPPEQMLALILARPLFSASRRPPASGGEATASGEFQDARLTGIVTMPGQRIALFAVSGAKTRMLTDGGVLDGWRIEDITPDEISLSGPGGLKKLQPKIDPKRPIPTPALARPAVVPPKQNAATLPANQNPFMRGAKP
jgi:hypothetical protein